MRRLVLLSVGLVAVPVLALAACSSSSSSGGDGGAPAPGPTCASGSTVYDANGKALAPCAWDQPVTQPSEATAATDRGACKYKRGDMPQATLGSSLLPVNIPIDNIVVVMMENHSFDSYLGHLNDYGKRTDIEVADAGATNPTADGGTAPWAHAQRLCTGDTDHSWPGTHQEINGGKMDGFFTVNDNPVHGDGGAPDPAIGSGARALWWYDQTDIPFYYQLANTYAVADHYHCSVPGPTWPNRMYLISATSFGETDNNFPDLSKFPYPSQDASILDELEKRGITWQMYADGVPGAGVVYGTSLISRWGRNNVRSSIKQFVADAKAGNLPAVSLVDPDLSSEMNKGAGTDEHPPGDIQQGELFVAQIVQAVTTSPQWAHTALFITHDEHGGFYDHVVPPPACAPDSDKPILGAGDTTQGGFDEYGVRVVLMAVSPYAKKGYVGHHTYDHSSITRFIEARFKLPALTGRDANAEIPTDLFDFTKASFATPAPLTMPTLDQGQYDYCTATFK